MSEQKDEKLQKVLARRGLGSRRQLEVWIVDGRVRINGKVARLGDRVTAQDDIIVDGHKIPDEVSADVQVLVYNKPEGELVSRNDVEGRSTVYERLPKPTQGRWISVGRLDINTTGLLLFTNDGELANKLMHPSSKIDREYAVRVLGEVDESMLSQLLTGVELEDGMARFSDISKPVGSGANRWFHVVIQEGRNREVRRLWESQGVKVSRLKRVRFGFMFLPSRIRAGKWELLGQKDVNVLYDMAGLPRKKVTLLSPEKRQTIKRKMKKSPKQLKTKLAKHRKAERTINESGEKNSRSRVPNPHKVRKT